MYISITSSIMCAECKIDDSNSGLILYVCVKYDVYRSNNVVCRKWYAHKDRQIDAGFAITCAHFYF